MVEGIFWALIAGIMLGLYALPSKFTKDFKFENTWGLFFILTMFVVPIIATMMLMKDVGGVFSGIETWKLAVMCVASFAWGCGVMMWGKAITHIGLSLGFSLFIGTVILVGSIWPFIIEGPPATTPMIVILAGIAVVLAGIYSNGRAGMARERDEAATVSSTEPVADKGEMVEESPQADQAPPATEKKVSMALGIFIAVFGGLLATGFNVAVVYGKPPLSDAVRLTGNPEWMTSLAIMFPVFLSGGVVMSLYFIWQLTGKKAWGAFKTPRFFPNLVLIFVMAFFHYAASAAYAYSAFRLGDLGATVGYAIYNTTCVVVAVVSGLVTREWVKASARAKRWLYVGLMCMVVGIIILTLGKFTEKKIEEEPQEITKVAEILRVE